MKWCIILWAFFSCGSAVINTLSSTVLSPVQGQSQALSFQIRKKKKEDGTLQAKFIGYTTHNTLSSNLAISQWLCFQMLCMFAREINNMSCN